MDWVGPTPPTAPDLAGRKTLTQGSALLAIQAVATLLPFAIWSLQEWLWGWQGTPTISALLFKQLPVTMLVMLAATVWYATRPLKEAEAGGIP